MDIEKSKDNNIFITHDFPIRFFFFCQYPDGKQLQRINAIRKKGWQIQDNKGTISLKNNRLTNAGRPFYSLSPLFLSSKVKLRGCTTCLWEGTLQQWHYEDQSNCCFMESSNSSDCVSEVSTLLVVMEVFTASVSPMAAIIVTLEPLETISVVVSS